VFIKGGVIILQRGKLFLCRDKVKSTRSVLRVVHITVVIIHTFPVGTDRKFSFVTYVLLPAKSKVKHVSFDPRAFVVDKKDREKVAKILIVIDVTRVGVFVSRVPLGIRLATFLFRRKGGCSGLEPT
jgi:hypothetical protein